jgi:cell division protein YceG involved in septum cleavage
MNSNNNQGDLKKFFIKLIAITFAIIVVINVTYNLIFAEKLENINKLLSLTDKENIELVKNKIRLEIEKGLRKDRIMNEEDKMLFYKLYLKIKNEFQEIEK